jgi:hypothetical protein
MFVIDVIVSGIVTNLPFAVLVMGASLDIGRLAEVRTVGVLMLNLVVAMLGGMCLFKRMLFHPFPAVIVSEGIYLVVL